MFPIGCNASKVAGEKAQWEIFFLVMSTANEKLHSKSLGNDHYPWQITCCEDKKLTCHNSFSWDSLISTWIWTYFKNSPPLIFRIQFLQPIYFRAMFRIRVHGWLVLHVTHPLHMSKFKSYSLLSCLTLEQYRPWDRPIPTIKKIDYYVFHTFSSCLVVLSHRSNTQFCE